MWGRFAALIVGIAVLLSIGPLVLHFGQKRHDRLAFSVMEAFPSDQPTASGEVFASTMASIVEHELSSLTGWRPNDFVLWGPGMWADNNANRQLGVIQAVRESSRILKDNLTKVSATQFDLNLVAADTALRNDAAKFWLPSAEGKFRSAVGSLHAYVAGLKTTPQTSKPMNRRNVEFIRLLNTWTDLLGDAHANLFKQQEEDGEQVPSWRIDDYFYHAQGFAHVLHHLTLAIVREWEGQFADRPIVPKLLHEIADALGEGARLKPLIVLDSSPASVFANHRRNLGGFINEARLKMYSLREELEK
jgi:hypothetical protein